MADPLVAMKATAAGCDCRRRGAAKRGRVPRLRAAGKNHWGTLGPRQAREPPAIKLPLSEPRPTLQRLDVLAVLLERLGAGAPDADGSNRLAAMLARDERLAGRFWKRCGTIRSRVLAQISGTQRQLLLAHRDATIRTLAEKLFASGSSVVRSAVVEAYRPALATPGDAERQGGLREELRPCPSSAMWERPSGRT
ncbi:MAG: hypothetical protein U0992_17165 [Planctomycetaceae bacterium]